MQVQKLLKCVPSASSRQTLLFSATLPSQLSTLTDLALRKEHVYIDCVGEEAPETATLVEQRCDCHYWGERISIFSLRSLKIRPKNVEFIFLIAELLREPALVSCM